MTQKKEWTCDGIGCESTIDASTYAETKDWYVVEFRDPGQINTTDLHFCSARCRQSGVAKKLGLREYEYIYRAGATED